jgi:hypothetical protein
MSSKYILLHGAKKNLGDYLIYNSAKKLLKKYKPQTDLSSLPAWEEFTPKKIDKVNNADAIIITGGPGIRKNIYPGVYPLCPNLNKIKTPIYTLGLGWKEFPGDEKNIYEFKFSEKAHMLLDKIKFFGVRDFYTLRILKKRLNQALLYYLEARLKL